jgi:hypothetical protein
MAGFRGMLEDGREAGGSLWAAEDPKAVVRRIWYALPVAGGLMAVVGGTVWGLASAVGVLAGAALAMANFRALHNGLRSVLMTGNEKPPSGTTLMFVFRWIIVATIGYAIYRTGWATGGGIIAGLLAPVLAIMGEAVFQLVFALTRNGTDDNDTK